MQSLAGDQLARVALTVLVFRATHSALATAAAYAVTFLPGLASAALGHLADRYSRRNVMVLCDLLRAVLLAAMAIPAVPIWGVCVLLSVAVAAGGPFQAASTAVVADLFVEDRYRSAVAIRQAGGQLAQLAGFAAGGVIVAATGARAALLLDALTFVASAGLVAYALRRRPSPARSTTSESAPSIRAGLSVLLRDPAQRLRLALICLLAFWIVPEGLAGPYAAAVGAGPVGVGVLLAALPLGYVASSLVLAKRVSGDLSSRLVGPLAVAAGLPLIGCVGTPPLAAAVLLWACCGACTGYMVSTMTEYISTTPPERRGQAAGVSSAAGLVAQGLGVLAGGALAQATTTGVAIACAGATGTALAAVIALQRTRVALTPTAVQSA